MIKKINIIFLLIISFFLCTSVFANKSKKDDSSVLSKLDSQLLQECLENIDLPECTKYRDVEYGFEDLELCPRNCEN